MDPARLKAIPIFSDLSEEEANRLAAFATETSVADGQILMKEGDFSTELIAIEEGTADVIQNGQKVASLGEGNPIRWGESRGDPREARYVEALARQLTPQATGVLATPLPRSHLLARFRQVFETEHVQTGRPPGKAPVEGRT